MPAWVTVAKPLCCYLNLYAFYCCLRSLPTATAQVSADAAAAASEGGGVVVFREGVCGRRWMRIASFDNTRRHSVSLLYSHKKYKY